MPWICPNSNHSTNLHLSAEICSNLQIGPRSVSKSQFRSFAKLSSNAVVSSVPKLIFIITFGLKRPPIYGEHRERCIDLMGSPTPPHLSSTFLFLSTSSQFGLTNGVKLDKVDSNLNSLRDSTGFHVRRGDHTRATRGDSEKVLWDFSGERDELWILSFVKILLEPTYLEREEKSWNQ